MDQGQQINQEPLGLSDDIFEFSQEFSYEKFQPMTNLRNLFDIQEIGQECPGKDINIQSLDMNHSTDVNT